MNSVIHALPPIDPWLASSLLQKAIRRGEVQLAQSAAAALYRLRGAMIWRRLTLIAFEDIGIGDLDLAAYVTTLSVDKTRRQPFGTDPDIISDVVWRMAEAPKCREPDFLICTAKQAPAFEALRGHVASLSVADRIRLATAPGMPLIDRSTAAWMASGVNGGGPQALCEGDLSGLMANFCDLGLPGAISVAVEAAALKTKEPIAIMVPLLWAMMRQSGEQGTIVAEQLPPSVSCRGVPSYAFDKHTRLGKRAVATLLYENQIVRECISDHVPEFRAREVAEMAAFYADAVALKRRIIWSQSSALETMGVETDMTKIGCPLAGVHPIIEIVRDHLDHLNEIRRRLFSTRGAGAAQSSGSFTQGTWS